jgi:hypothetical protein
MVNGASTSKRHVGGANSSSRRGEDRGSAKKYGTRTSTGTLKPKKYELESEGDDDFVDNAADNRRRGPPVKREYADNNHHVDNNSRHAPSPRKRVRHHQSDDSDEDEDNDSTQSGAAMRAKKARHDGERSQQMPTSFGRELRHTTTTTGRSPPDEVVRHVAPSRPQHTASTLRNGGTHSSDHRSARPGRVNNTHDETDEDEDEEESTDEEATEEEGETTEEDASDDDDEELKRKVRNGGASARQKAPARADRGEDRARATRNQGRRTIVYREDHSDDDDEDGATSRSRVRKPSGHVFH